MQNAIQKKRATRPSWSPTPSKPKRKRKPMSSSTSEVMLAKEKEDEADRVKLENVAEEDLIKFR